LTFAFVREKDELDIAFRFAVMASVFQVNSGAQFTQAVIAGGTGPPSFAQGYGPKPGALAVDAALPPDF
jgi:hypothetical protein